jgi:hypothetical protein
MRVNENKYFYNVNLSMRVNENIIGSGENSLGENKVTGIFLLKLCK